VNITLKEALPEVGDAEKAATGGLKGAAIFK